MSSFPTTSPEALGFFARFGYLILRGFLPLDRVTQLRTEVIDSLAHAFGIRLHDPNNPSADFFLPMMGPRTPVSRKLAVDPRLLSLGAALLGESPNQLLIKPAKGNCYLGASQWHMDWPCQEMRSLKVAAYLEPLGAATGALRVLPGSHQGTLHQSMREFLGLSQPVPERIEDLQAAIEHEVPGVILPVVPGDVVVFDVRLWHASTGGQPRHQWTVSYVKSPRTPHEAQEVRQYIESFLSAGHQYDTASYPYYDPDWATGGDSPGSRALRAIEP